MNKTERILAADYRRINNGDTDLETVQRNRQSNDRGRNFENLLMKGAQHYALNEIAIINKVYEPYICLKLQDNGKFTGRFTGRAEPDFKGVLKGGRAIAFEAKSTQKDKMFQSVLTSEQSQWLDEQNAMGAVTYVCINIKNKFYTLPWFIWKNMKEKYGRKYITPEDIYMYEVIFDGSVRFLEYKNGATITKVGVTLW